MRHQTPPHGLTLPLLYPYIAGKKYAPGRQPNAPGESCLPYGSFFQKIPWPTQTGLINALSSFAGVPRDMPIAPVNNATTVLPANYLYIDGFVGKSRG